MDVLRYCKDPCDQLLLRLILMVLILGTDSGKVNWLDYEVEQVMVPNQHDSLDNSHPTHQSIDASNGGPAILGEFPHMAAIGWRQPDRSLLWNCGGSLISVNYILTAAHCSKDINLSEPRVAHLGDINLYNASDDRHAQQRNIIEIKIHPNYAFRNKYHDIALMRLDRSVTVHDAVVPICLWNKGISHFNSFEAVGWGETSFRGMHSPFLVKVSLRLVGKSNCNKLYLHTRGLGVGLHDNQMCAGDEKMDTCPGDSGGPLQVMHYYREFAAPVLVGVTSFGLPCGLSAPGIYTKVAPYIPWITSTLKSGGENVPGTGNTLSTVSNSLIEPNRSQYGVNSFGFILKSTSLTVAAHGRPAYFGEFAHMAAIGWSQPESSPLWNCGGSLIWGNYILTAAHCAEDGSGIAPDVVRLGDLNLYDASDDIYAQQSKIIEIIRHPDHVFSKKYHDIALIRLDKRLTIDVGVAPLCLWNGDVTHFPSFEAVGWGDTGFLEERSPILLKVSLTPVDLLQCSRHYLRSRGLGAGLQDSQMCAGDIKMDTCPGDSGGPLQVKLMNNTRVIPFVVGVTSFGAACGFSVPGVYTRVAPYIPWIFNVLKERGERVAEWMFQPGACATDYAELRENDPPVGQDDTNLVEYQDLGRVLVLEHKAKMRQTLREQQLALNLCEDKTERLCVD